MRVIFDALHGISNTEGRDEYFFLFHEVFRFWIFLVHPQCPTPTSLQSYYSNFHPHSVKTSEALEIIAYCLFDGKVDQKSKLETDLYNDLVEQLKDLFWHKSKSGYKLSDRHYFRRSPYSL